MRKKNGGKLDLEQATLEQAGDAGKHMQKEGINALKRANTVNENTLQIARDAEVELQAQNERLMRLDDSCQKIDATGDRVNKYIRYFRKELAADKPRLCMCTVIILLIVMLVVALTIPDKNAPKVTIIDGKAVAQKSYLEKKFDEFMPTMPTPFWEDKKPEDSNGKSMTVKNSESDISETTEAGQGVKSGS